MLAQQPSGPTRHAQLPAATPGVFMRAVLSMRSTSCIGTTAVRATESMASRMEAQAGSKVSSSPAPR